MSTVKRLYRCPKCGDVLTDVEWEASFEIGGSGYCTCQYGMNKDGEFERVLLEYEVFVKNVPNAELEGLQQKLLVEIEDTENYLKTPIGPWDVKSGEVSPLVKRRQMNDKLVDLNDLYERCFPDVERVLDFLREKYREHPLY